MLTGLGNLTKQTRRPLVYAHRGGDLIWPGNTIMAFDEALKLGSDWLEMDVRCTKDGVLVLMHNPTVEDASNQSRLVADFTLKELKKVDAAYWWGPDKYPYRGKDLKIPTLEEVFVKYKDLDVPMNIEIKQIMPSIVDRFCDLVLKYGMSERILVASFSTSVLRQIRAKLPQAATSAGTWEMLVFYLFHWLDLTHSCRRLKLIDRYHLPVQALQFWSSAGPFPIITKSLVTAAHRYGLEIHGWTVNKPREMKRMIRLRVDGIITDNPITLIDLIN